MKAITTHYIPPTSVSAETRAKVDQLTKAMADEVERLAPLNPTIERDDIARAVVEAHGLSFNAWFCVSCELGEREQARRTA